MCVCVCVCVCKRETDRQTDSDRQTKDKSKRQDIYIYIYILERGLKSIQADQDKLTECDQIFIFQHRSLCGPHTSFMSVAELGPHWSKSHRQPI